MFAASKTAAAAVATAANYIEDVFSTYLYTGNSANRSITNGIDLSTKGGMVWIKTRDQANGHELFDTARGVQKALNSNTTSAQGSTDGLTAFNADGFSLNGTDTWANYTNFLYTSWTFRKQAKFFDVVTYTGDGSNRTIAHSLGSVPGCIIVKRTDTTGDWQVYHRSLANTEYIVLNSTAAKATGTTRWNSTTPTSTEFSLGTDATVNANSGTYVAYLFAHDAGGFGLTGTDNVISCGSFTTNGSGVATVDLGYEPQWVMWKASSSVGNWVMIDNMRGWAVNNSDDARLRANLSNAENMDSLGNPTATGFYVNGGDPNATHIYIAIRRGPMKTPTSGTSVFSPYSGVGSTNTNAGFPVDMSMAGNPVGSSSNFFTQDRLRGGTAYLRTSNTGAELDTTSTYPTKFDSNTGVNISWWNSSTTIIDWQLRRAPGFFDVVCYTGTGSATTVTHNLGVAPELMIVKKRSAADAWIVYANNDNTDYLVLNTTAATVDDNTIWNDTSPTSSVFTVGTNDDVNGNTATFVAYLFATVAGVSKVGSYTGTGTTKQIDCGFTGGARFVLIKRTDSTGDWYVWDSARGIVTADDPYLLLNSTAAEVTNTDYVDTYSAGFEISSTAPAAINANGGSFIFLAIA